MDDMLVEVVSDEPQLLSASEAKKSLQQIQHAVQQLTEACFVVDGKPVKFSADLVPYDSRSLQELRQRAEELLALASSVSASYFRSYVQAAVEAAPEIFSVRLRPPEVLPPEVLQLASDELNVTFGLQLILQRSYAQAQIVAELGLIDAAEVRWLLDRVKRDAGPPELLNVLEAEAVAVLYSCLRENVSDLIQLFHACASHPGGAAGTIWLLEAGVLLEIALENTEAAQILRSEVLASSESESWSEVVVESCLVLARNGIYPESVDEFSSEMTRFQATYCRCAEVSWRQMHVTMKLSFEDRLRVLMSPAGRRVLEESADKSDASAFTSSLVRRILNKR